MLGVCYYPEQWDDETVKEDVIRMKELGLKFVRIGEFSWSKIEPEPQKFCWDWLGDFLDLLMKHGLKAVIGTPTATPPKWLVDAHPEMLPVDEEGRQRRFGSRRHYCFSNSDYRGHVERIVTLLARRFGKHPAVIGWQLDNEYGCHNTVRCYCPRCREGFQKWLEEKYGSIENLNQAWGTLFWSQRYRDFSEIELPNLTVAEPNPAHVLDYHRFASDQVVLFNQLQAGIIHDLSPGRFVTTNFMGFFFDFDHYRLARDLDFASWDSYPLGFTAVGRFPDEEKRRYATTGHPDVAAFHHDLYRGMGGGRFWVMEQQPGPVNWAPYNPVPEKGMVRLWTWEAFAHGAGAVSYFRWRQAPFAQEQMHSGLLRPDSIPDQGYHEVKQVAEELADIGLPPQTRAQVAIVFDYEAAWVYEIQPHGGGLDYFELVFTFYSALRRLGLAVDILSRHGPFEGYKLVIVPSLPVLRDEDVEAFRAAGCPVVFGPRTGSKTSEFQIPKALPPGPLQELMPLRVPRVESLLSGVRRTVSWMGRCYPAERWREYLETPLSPVATFEDGLGAVVRNGNYTYLAFWPSLDFLLDFLEEIFAELDIQTSRLPEDLRIRRCGKLVFAFNYSSAPKLLPIPAKAAFLLGKNPVEPYGVAIWEERE